MKYDFDRPLEQDAASIKWGVYAGNGKYGGAIPMWIADMDFETAQEIREALQKRAEHPVYGYTELTQAYFEAICGWMERRHGYKPEREWVVTAPGVLTALNITLQALTNPGAKITLNTPAYMPFFDRIAANGRELAPSPFIREGEGYSVDFEDFEGRIAESELFILCNPHNPSGRLFSHRELTRMADICLKHGVYIVADEVHSDLVYGGGRHISMGALDGRYRDRLVILTAPSKTFNLAGLCLANMIIPGDETRRRIARAKDRNGPGENNIFGATACAAGYAHGEEWLDQVLAYIEANRDFALDFIGRRLPRIRPFKPQGTYFLWLDCAGLGLAPEELEPFFAERAGVRVSDGIPFGGPSGGGGGFVRVNLACPRSTLSKALERIADATESLP